MLRYTYQMGFGIDKYPCPCMGMIQSQSILFQAVKVGISIGLKYVVRWIRYACTHVAVLWITDFSSLFLHLG